MTPQLLREIVDLLIPLFGVAAARQAKVGLALHGCPVLRQIEWEGATQVFTINMLQRLLDFGECNAGESAVVTLLKGMQDEVGLEKAERLGAIIRQLESTRR